MGTEHTLHLQVLGCEVTLRFTHAYAVEQAAAMFEALLTTPWRTPDILIECDWPVLTREFVRSRASGSPGPLPGIRMYSADHPDGSDWQSVDPPFPPVDLAPFRDRFVRLHAGAVADEQGRALVILGESGYGKSTLCFRLTADHGYSLLTDEDAFVHRRSRLIEPFPVGYAPWKTHVDVPAIQPTIADSAATIERILVLRPPGRAAEKPSKIGSKECLWALLEGQRPSGTPHPEVIATLTALARSVPAAEMSGGRYRNLINAAADVADFGEVSAV